MPPVLKKMELPLIRTTADVLEEPVAWSPGPPLLEAVESIRVNCVVPEFARTAKPAAELKEATELRTVMTLLPPALSPGPPVVPRKLESRTRTFTAAAELTPAAARPAVVL